MYPTSPGPTAPRMRKMAPMPKIIQPKIQQNRQRRLIDSALGSRPTSARAVDEAKNEIMKLKVKPPEEKRETKEVKEIREPTTTKAAPILSLIKGLESDHPGIALDQILGGIKGLGDEELYDIDFDVYHTLVRALFGLITNIYSDFSKENYPILFKSLALCLRIMPESDRELLDVIIKLVYEISKDEYCDRLFVDSGVIPILVKHAFSYIITETSTYSAASLRHIANDVDCLKEIFKTDIINSICKALQTRTRKDRFQKSIITYIYQVVGLLAIIAPQITDWDFIEIHPLPIYIMQISSLYSSDDLLHHQIAKAFSILMLHEEAVESIETEDLMPVFALLSTNRPEVVDLALLGLANAVAQSELVTSSVVYMIPPFGPEFVCRLLQRHEKALDVSAARILAKVAQFQRGSEIVFKFLPDIFKLLDYPLDDLETWTDEQMIVANALVILKALCVNHVEDVVAGMKGRMHDLMYYGILDYVIGLMREMMKCDEGWAVCEEVNDVDEIVMMLPVLAN